MGDDHLRGRSALQQIAPMVVEGAMTGEMFLAYIEKCLVPLLRRNDIVVMDNCRVHLGPGISSRYREIGSDVTLPAKVFARPQSHRDALQQIQDLPAQGRSANRQRP